MIPHYSADAAGETWLRRLAALGLVTVRGLPGRARQIVLLEAEVGNRSTAAIELISAFGDRGLPASTRAEQIVGATSPLGDAPGQRLCTATGAVLALMC